MRNGFRILEWFLIILLIWDDACDMIKTCSMENCKVTENSPYQLFLFKFSDGDLKYYIQYGLR